ncbi:MULTISPECIES: hypothetical protein [Streptomyces]|uniref:Transposase n=1 Tax=Streptomyces mutomycini TaxID=284036 RepID=A0ABW0BCM1_9ACTN|nr:MULTISPECIES: hypothetical protein [Streptomyces]
MASVKAEQAHSKSVTTLVRLRRDRILNEVFATGDALKVMRLLGITAQTAMP